MTPVRAVAAPLAAAEMPQAALANRTQPVANARPELMHMVEPEVPQRLLTLLSRPEVTVEFTIRADGGVSGVVVLPPVPRQVVPIIAAAVEQWRYAPSPASRQHRVQLVFKDSP